MKGQAMSGKTIFIILHIVAVIFAYIAEISAFEFQPLEYISLFSLYLRHRPELHLEHQLNTFEHLMSITANHQCTSELPFEEYQSLKIVRYYILLHPLEKQPVIQLSLLVQLVHLHQLLRLPFEPLLNILQFRNMFWVVQVFSL